MSIEVPALLPVISDFIFKLIFGDQRNVDILAEFLKSVLDIPDTEYDRITVVDPHVKKESQNDKYGILDVKVHTKSGNVIHVEIQVWPIPEMKQRSIFFLSKMVTEQMASGKNHSDIKRVVSIIITNYTLVPENNYYHNQFRYRSDKDGAEFTNLTEINSLELSKLPTDADDTELWYWMKFIKSDDDEEVLNMLAQRSPQMRKAVGVLKELSADERTRMLYEEREIARRDIVSMVNGAKKEIAGKLLHMNVPIDQIVTATGLTREEVENLGVFNAAH
ncbi:MAG: Rpn family recombination-promoting nuclease/putative transposase [Synergistaceae bacterium]|nr:Rpn family recombination-promoting nuclease/putative transposase [Synergistaceae bacterium]